MLKRTSMLNFGIIKTQMEKIKIKLERLEMDWLISLLMSINTRSHDEEMNSAMRSYELFMVLSVESMLTRYIDKAINSELKKITITLTLPESHAIVVVIAKEMAREGLRHEIAWATSITTKLDAAIEQIISRRKRLHQIEY